MTKVLDGDFEWHDGKLVFLPTGIRFNPGFDTIENIGQLGEVLDEGRQYEMDELNAAALRIMRAAAHR